MTPEVICSDVEKLIENLNCNTEPVYVNCDPEEGEEIVNCFPIVEKRVQKSGGSLVLGWAIWKGILLVEAEFHAVWKTSEGNLVDISPRILPFKKILFVPDLKAKYEGKQVDNVRINIVGNGVVDDFIQMWEAKFKIENKGDRAYQYGSDVKYDKEEKTALRMLQEFGMGLERMAMQGLSYKAPCFCRSSKKYKNCHRPKFLKLIQSI